MKTRQLQPTTNYYKLLKGLVMMSIFTFCFGVANAQCLAGYTYSVDPSNNGQVNFTNTSTPTPSPMYYWSFGDGTGSYSSDPTHVFATGTYVVCLTAYDSTGVDSSGVFTGCSATFCDSITVVNDSTPAGGGCTAYFVVVQDSTNLYNYFVYNYSTTAGVSTTYLWDFGDGTTDTSAYPSHTYPLDATYYLCLTITDGAGCTATYCDTVAAGHGMSSVITVNVVNPVTAGIHESEITSTFQNYPNPFSGSTTIHYTISKDASVELNVVDLLGNKIATVDSGNKTSGEHSIVWNAGEVSQGMYLLQMNVNSHVNSKKIIVTK